jgi:hypothetical protein
MAATLGLALNFDGMAYEQSTHQILTQVAIDRSVLMTNPNLLPSFGYQDFYEVAPTFDGAIPTFRANSALRDGVVWGAWFEDEVRWDVAFRHFFDPQWSTSLDGVGRGLTVPDSWVVAPLPPPQTFKVLGARSPDWILEYRIEDPSQYYSFKKAQQQLKAALTSYYPEDRTKALGMTFQSLGHIVHHIQDMAQPQHVRNEPHIHDPGGHKEIRFPASVYELHTEANFNRTLDAKLRKQWPTYAVPSFPRVSDYWFSSGPNRFSGMADFTARNFITFNTGFKQNSSASGPSVVNLTDEFPLPNGTNFDGSPMRVELRTGLVKDVKGQFVQGQAMYVIGKVHDGLSGIDTLDQRLAIESGTTAGLSLNSKKRYSWDDPSLWEDNQKILLPRAVAFSAGLINHFFRGSVKFARKSGLTWTVTNSSQFSMSGTYSVYASLSTGAGDMRVPMSSAAYSMNLAAGQSVDITLPGEPPQGTRELVLLFEGTVGSEPERVTGVVVPYTASPPSTPVTACGASGGYFSDDPIRHNFGNQTSYYVGGKKIVDSVVNLGDTVGTVAMSVWFQEALVYGMTKAQSDSLTANPFPPGTPPPFTPVSMSEKVTIFYNGSELRSDTISGPGSHTYTFNWNPTTAGGSTITVRESFPWYDARTLAYEVPSYRKLLSCPNQGLNTSDGLTTITFAQKNPPGQFGCGVWSYSIDGSTFHDARYTASVIAGAKVYVDATFKDNVIGHVCLSGTPHDLPTYIVNGVERNIAPPTVIAP